MNEKAESRMEITGGCVCGGTRYVLKSAPFSLGDCHCIDCRRSAGAPYVTWGSVPREGLVVTKGEPRRIDRKSTRLNSSHSQISYAVFCLKKKKETKAHSTHNNIN